MAHTVELPDDLYRAIERYAAERGETAEALILAWAQSLTNPASHPSPTQTAEPMYDPADDPLAEFLGTVELIEPDAVRRHDEVIADEALDAHDK
jgi:hypothetical protein